MPEGVKLWEKIFVKKLFDIDASLFSKVFHSKVSYNAPTRDRNKLESCVNK